MIWSPWKKLCDVGIVTLRHILMPTLLDLVLLHVVHIFHLDNKNIIKAHIYNRERWKKGKKEILSLTIKEGGIGKIL